MGHLVERIDVDKAPFKLIPPALITRFKVPDVYSRDPDLHDMENVYAFCHEWVFDKRPKGRVGIHRKLILQRVCEAQTSIKLFFLANMYGWRESHPEDFSSRLLTQPFAVTQVNTFASTCHKMYGTFDTTSLDMLMGSDKAKEDLETRLLHSEVIAGSWIVGYKMFNSGEMCQKLYVENEAALHPSWLAIEQTYFDCILKDHIASKDRSQNPVLVKHRWNTMRLLGKLKRNERQALVVFGTREKIMPEAVRRVLGKRGLRPEHFQVENIPVVNPIKFWARLGVALQHYECLKFVEKTPSAFDAKIRSASTR